MRPALACLLLAAFAAPARADLKPDEVGLIAMATSREGRGLAEHYAQVRGVPKANVLLLDGAPGDDIGRQAWEGSVRPAIRAWLAAGGREERIRCLVTCWDVPLRIGPRDPASPVVVARKDLLGRARLSHTSQLSRLLHVLQSVGRDEQPAAAAAIDAKAGAQQIGQQFDAAMKEAQQRLQGLDSDEKKKQAGTVMERVLAAVGGVNALLQIAAGQAAAAEAKPEVAAQIALLKGRMEGLQQGLRALDALPDTAARDVQLLNILVQTNGLIGCLQWIDQQNELLEKNETGAAFDSELSLIAWDDYPLFRWQPNLLHYSFDHVQGKRPTMMVSRLAAPSIGLAARLVDTAVSVEKAGLSGKVYLDARGVGYTPGKGERGSYGEYDQSLRDLAERLKKHTKLEVVLDNDPKLFQPGSCPDAALYCGWYSLGNYVDAFEWKPGAVGYHLASMEAATLRDPQSKVWCAAMLADGVAATLGPVSEPYLAAFPLPDEFFSLLLTGRYTLVETYYRTSPFTSWQMTLVGDPLYNPFKSRPQLGEDALPERMKQASAPAGELAHPSKDHNGSPRLP